MDSVAISYCKTLQSQFRDFYATWPPNAPLRLGDFGYLQAAVFSRKSSLGSLGVGGWKTRSGRSAASTYTCATSSGTELRFHAKGEANPGGVPLAKATAEVKFSRGAAVFFNAAGCVLEEIEDQIGLGRTILDMFGKKTWNDDWCVVTGIVRAGATTVAVSADAGASVVLEATADQPTVDLANADAALQVGTSRSLSSLIVGEAGFTPLVRLSKVRRKFFGGRVFSIGDPDEQDTFDLRQQLIIGSKNVSEAFEFSVITPADLVI
jgi:hypothetical protein